MKVLIAGATGLIGNHLLHFLLENSAITEVVALLRKKTDLKNEKLNQVVFDFDKEENYKNLGDFDAVFCCLGTTIKKAGSKENFLKVDFQYPLSLAKHISTKQFHIVSSMGADETGFFFYAKTKGKIEEKLKGLKIETLHIYRPSQLEGNRKEFRLGEQISEQIMRLFSVAIPEDYKLIQAKTVAKAMLNNTFKTEKGTFTHFSGEIKTIANKTKD